MSSYALCALLDPPPHLELEHGHIVCVPFNSIISSITEDLVMIKYGKNPRCPTEAISVTANLIFTATYEECRAKLLQYGECQQKETGINQLVDDNDDDDVQYVDTYPTPLRPEPSEPVAGPSRSYDHVKVEVGATSSNSVLPSEIQDITNSNNPPAASSSASTQDPGTRSNSQEPDNSKSQSDENSSKRNKDNRRCDKRDPKAIVFSKNLNNIFAEFSVLTTRLIQAVKELKTEKSAEDVTETVNADSKIEKELNKKENGVTKDKRNGTKRKRSKGDGKEKADGEPSALKIRLKVRTPLSPEVSVADSKWTLKYPKYRSRLLDLNGIESSDTEGTGDTPVYIKSSKLLKLAVTAKDRKSFARSLLTAIFNDKALKRCFIPCRRSRTNDHDYLDKHAMTVLLKTVSKFGDERGLPGNETDVIQSLRQKLKNLHYKANRSRKF